MDEIMDQLNQVIEERVLELKRKSEEDKVPAYCTETKEHVLRTDRILNSLSEDDRQWLDDQLMKIDSANLKWYAAFHNESHHPHVHLLVYSVKDGEGYLTKQSIEAMRSELAHDIFRQDFANIYEEQAQSRMDLKERSEVVMKTWIDEIRAGTLKS